MLYTIADLTFYMEPDSVTKQQAKKYLEKKDRMAEFEIFPPNIDQFKAKKQSVDFETYQYLLCGFRFYCALLEYKGIMQHASAVVVDNKAYLFSAPSGTGKSTHTGKWLELFGDKAYILNDDKPAIRILDDGIYAYGTPWSGKHDISVNKKVPLQGICFLTRDTENWIKPMEKISASVRIYHAALHNLSTTQLSNQLDIINQIIEHIPIYEMGCTPTIEAARMAYNVMSKEEVK